MRSVDILPLRPNGPDVGIDYAWCQTRFRLLPKPKAQAKTRKVSAPKETEVVG